MSASLDFDFVFCVPGTRTIIDTARPDGRSAIEGETLEEVQRRYPGAVLMPWEEFRAEQIARQSTPVEWIATTEEKFYEMLGVLPPIAWDARGFMVGEACDHDYATGRARYQAYRHRHGAYEGASRPMTIAEFKAIKVAE